MSRSHGPFTNVDVWRPGIDKYGAVTHLTVVLYDADEHTVCGPTPSSSLFAFFEKYGHDPGTVSYTHLTLPTIYSV